MGNYCRDWAEESQKDTAKGIMGTSDSEYNQQIANAIPSRLGYAYTNAKIAFHAKWVGAEAYDDKGDIKVYLSDGTEVRRT